MTDERPNTVLALPEDQPVGEPALLMTDSKGKFVPAPEALAVQATPVLAQLVFTGQMTTDLRGEAVVFALACLPQDLRLLRTQIEGLIEAAEEATIL